MDRFKVDFESIEWTAPAPGVRFKVRRQDGIQLRLVEFSREFVEYDWCTRGHIGYVLEGEFEVDFSGRVITFRKGDGIFVPPGERHKARAVSETARAVFVEDAG